MIFEAVPNWNEVPWTPDICREQFLGQFDIATHFVFVGIPIGFQLIYLHSRLTKRTMVRRLDCTTSESVGGMQWTETVSGDHWRWINHPEPGRIEMPAVPCSGSAVSTEIHCCKRSHLTRRVCPWVWPSVGLLGILELSYEWDDADPEHRDAWPGMTLQLSRSQGHSILWDVLLHLVLQMLDHTAQGILHVQDPILKGRELWVLMEGRCRRSPLVEHLECQVLFVVQGLGCRGSRWNRHGLGLCSGGSASRNLFDHGISPCEGIRRRQQWHLGVGTFVLLYHQLHKSDQTAVTENFAVPVFGHHEADPTLVLPCLLEGVPLMLLSEWHYFHLQFCQSQMTQVGERHLHFGLQGLQTVDERHGKSVSVDQSRCRALEPDSLGFERVCLDQLKTVIPKTCEPAPHDLDLELFWFPLNLSWSCPSARCFQVFLPEGMSQCELQGKWFRQASCRKLLARAASWLLQQRHWGWVKTDPFLTVPTELHASARDWSGGESSNRSWP